MHRYLLLAALLVLAACAPTADTTTMPQDDATMPDESMDDSLDTDPNLHGNEVMDNTEAFRAGPLAVVTDQVPYHDGAVGFEARPEAPGEYPGVIMIHEWWGLNQNIKDMAEVLASHGYHVIAVDLYEGDVAQTFDEARELVTSFDSQAGVENMQSAIAYLEDQGAPSIASLGWCFGGAQSLSIAQNADLDATIIYYGNVDSGVQGVDEPVLGLFGAEDGSIPVSSVETFESQLSENGVSNDINIYAGAGHAFANPSGDRFQQEAAEDAWDKTIAFLASELGDSLPEDSMDANDVIEIAMTGQNFDFFVDGEENPTITVQEGDTVRITFEATQGFHDVVIDAFGASEKVRSGDGTTTLEFVADQTGEFEYYCSVGSHRAQGMFGTFIVE